MSSLGLAAADGQLAAARAIREYLAACLEAERYGVPSAARDANNAAAVRQRIATVLETERPPQRARGEYAYCAPAAAVMSGRGARQRRRDAEAARRPQRPSLARVQAHAACRGMDIDLFFPGRADTQAVARAKAVCSGCSVRRECGEYALARPEEFGVWGGMSETERADERRRRDAVARSRQRREVAA